jgi:hypothetical protein
MPDNPAQKPGKEHPLRAFAALNRKGFLVKITLLFPLNLQTHQADTPYDAQHYR